MVIGDDLTIDDDEREVLEMPPKFACFNLLSEEGFEVDVEICGAKHRWEMRNKDDEVSEEEVEQAEPPLLELLEVLDAQSRQVFDPEEGNLDMRKRKATDVKHNTRVGLPKALKPSEEAMIEVRKAEWMRVFRELAAEVCDEKGQQQSNLTPAQRRGLQKLRKRIKEGELIVCMTDKSGKLSVMSIENYQKAGSVHTEKDEEVDLNFVKNNQKEVNAHTAMWLKIWKYGANWKHEDRHRETKINQSCSVSPLWLLMKDHKAWNPEEGPKTRPVCGTNKGMNVHFSDLVSEVLEPVATARQGTAEVISTEDMVSLINDFNDAQVKADHSSVQIEADPSSAQSEADPSSAQDKADHSATQIEADPSSDQVEANHFSTIFQEGEGSEVLVGADADVLYPSLEAEMAGRAAKSAILETEVKFEGVNYKEAARYVVLASSESDLRLSKLRRILPWRRHVKGTRPKLTGPGPRGPTVNDEEQWYFPQVELTEKEKRELIATVVQIGVIATFRTHVYQFGGRYYHQKSGGPIGLRATGAIARIVMGEWDIKFMEILVKNGIKVDIAARYVDDIRTLLRALKMGCRWTGSCLEYRDEWKYEDEARNISPTQKTSEVLHSIMNSLYTNLNFTMETGDDFDGGKLPTLDMQLWMEGGKVMYKFYEKPMAAKTVIQKLSALSENSKVASLSQEVIRRMKNTSEQLQIVDRVEVIDMFSGKLMASGYSREQTARIITAGLRGYEKARKRDQEGRGKLHKSAAAGAGARNRKKLLAKSSWFKQAGVKADQ